MLRCYVIFWRNAEYALETMWGGSGCFDAYYYFIPVIDSMDSMDSYRPAICL